MASPTAVPIEGAQTNTDSGMFIGAFILALGLAFIGFTRWIQGSVRTESSLLKPVDRSMPEKKLPENNAAKTSMAANKTAKGPVDKDRKGVLPLLDAKAEKDTDLPKTKRS